MKTQSNYNSNYNWCSTLSLSLSLSLTHTHIIFKLTYLMMILNSCVSGGALGTNGFMKKLSAKLYYKKIHARADNYCAFYDLRLQLAISTIYVMIVISALMGRRICKSSGTRRALTLATLSMLMGVGLTIGSKHRWMLIVGLILQSCGVGLTYQVNSQKVCYDYD